MIVIRSSFDNKMTISHGIILLKGLISPFSLLCGFPNVKTESLGLRPLSPLVIY